MVSLSHGIQVFETNFSNNRYRCSIELFMTGRATVHFKGHLPPTMYFRSVNAYFING